MRAADEQHVTCLQTIRKLPLYQKLSDDPLFKLSQHSALIPKAHLENHVGQGFLFGPKHLEVDPIVFTNRTDKTLVGFYHLGKNLVGYDEKIHNGLIATLLDETLCFCGFPFLPNKRGVTARLSVDYLGKAERDSAVVLYAKVVQQKGRKCIIDGNIETVDGREIARARCVLVEPKWFKFFKFIPMFQE